MRPTLGLTGVTVNAMALIAPGAFLWITLQIQSAQTVPGGTASTSLDIWPGIVFALILAFMTALSYSELARIYPEAGSGSCYYFGEQALVGFSPIASWYRVANPDNAQFVHPTATSVILPKDVLNVLMQSTVAILILVGFESCTAFGAEAKNARRDVPRAVIIALVVQGL